MSIFLSFSFGFPCFCQAQAMTYSDAFMSYIFLGSCLGKISEMLDMKYEVSKSLSWGNRPTKPHVNVPLHRQLRRMQWVFILIFQISPCLHMRRDEALLGFKFQHCDAIIWYYVLKLAGGVSHYFLEFQRKISKLFSFFNSLFCCFLYMPVPLFFFLLFFSPVFHLSRRP